LTFTYLIERKTKTVPFQMVSLPPLGKQKNLFGQNFTRFHLR